MPLPSAPVGSSFALSPPVLPGAVDRQHLRVPLRHEALDEALQGGLARGAVHEIGAENVTDCVSAESVALAFSLALAQVSPLLWVWSEGFERENGTPYGPGLAALGLDSSRFTCLRVKDPREALQATLDAARCPSLGAVLMALWGDTPAYDLTASRRLALAAQNSGTPIILLRAGGALGASAAHTRWMTSARPSRALEARAPGPPSFALTLMKQRHGRSGQTWIVEWNRDDLRLAPCSFAPVPIERPIEPPLSGAVVPLSAHRPGEDSFWPKAG